MKKTMWAVAVLAVLAIVAPKVLAQDAPAPAGPRPQRDPVARMMAMLEKLDLTADQKTKAKEILDAAKAKADKAETPEAKREAMTAGMDDVKKNVLTEEQRKKLEAMPGPGRGMGAAMFDKLDLTADQKAKVKEIMDAAKAKADKEQDRQAKREIIKAAIDDIKKNVLTEEQRKKLEEQQKNRPGPGGPGGPRQPAGGDAPK